jgi:hypothetical protein
VITQKLWILQKNYFYIWAKKNFTSHLISLARSANKFPSDHGTQGWAGKQLKYRPIF